LQRTRGESDNQANGRRVGKVRDNAGGAHDTILTPFRSLAKLI